MVKSYLTLQDCFRSTWDVITDYLLAFTDIPTMSASEESKSNTIMQRFLWYMQKSRNKARYIPVFSVLRLFPITDNVKQYPCSSVETRPRLSYWWPKRHHTWSKLIVPHRVQQPKLRMCWQYWKRTGPHPGPDILFHGSRRSANVSYITGTISSSHGHPSRWVSLHVWSHIWQIVTEKVAFQKTKQSQQAASKP